MRPRKRIKSFSPISNEQPLTKKTQPTYDKRSQLSLLSLPTDVIDIILHHYFPLVTTENIAFQCLAKKVLPLALTCRFMFQRVAKFLVQCVQYLPMMGETISYYDPQGLALLQKACAIAIAQFRKQEESREKSISEHKQRRAITRSMAFAQTSLIDIPALRHVDNHPPGFRCTESAPLFSSDGHEWRCKSFLSWFTIAATTGKVDALRLYFHHTSENDVFESCVLRLWISLKLPLKKLYLREQCHATSSNGSILLHTFLKSVSSTLEVIEMDIYSSSFITALCNIKFPSLKSISFNAGDNRVSIPSYPKKSIIRILRALRRNGTKLEGIELLDHWFSVFNDHDKPLNLAQLAPTVRYLCIVQFELDEPGEWERTFQYCNGLERLELHSSIFAFGAFDVAKRHGVLPNLKHVILQHADELGMPETPLDPESKSSVQLISKLKMAYPIVFNRKQLEIMNQAFASTPEVEMRVLYPDRSHLASYVRNAHGLKKFAVNVDPRKKCEQHLCLEFEELMLYSEELIDALLIRCENMDSIRVYGCCATVDQITQILRKMGRSVENFRMVLSENEKLNENEFFPCRVSPDDVIQVLDVVVEHCPNIRKLRLMPCHGRVGWNPSQLRIVENAVKNACRRLPLFESWSFIKDFGYPLYAKL